MYGTELSYGIQLDTFTFSTFKSPLNAKIATFNEFIST